MSLSQMSCSPDPQTKGEDGAVMLLIPSGEYTRGGKADEVADHPKKGGFNFLAERPLHRVRISSFYIDKFEVTNERYGIFLDYVKSSGDTAMNHPDQPDSDHEQMDWGLARIAPELRGTDQPAVGVSWFDAYAYCKWVDRRLPTEAEWEYAARGSGEYRTYPWGNKPAYADGIWRANYSPKVGKPEDGYQVTAPVGSYPDGLSPFGVADMAGNAEEWVNDRMDPRYYLTQADGVQDPQGPEEGDLRTIKGGSYHSGVHYIRIGTRLYGPPSAQTRLQGFRCAKDI